MANINGTSGNDSLTGTSGADVIRGHNGDDTLHGGSGSGLLGTDYLYGGHGNDSLTGGAGLDHLFGGDGNDTLTGTGLDLLYGGDGDDLLMGSGAVTIEGGIGNDTIIGGAGLVVDGSTHVDDMDVLDLTGLGPLIVVPDLLIPGTGIVTFLNGLGQSTGVMVYANIEKIIPCFTPGTLITCEDGERRVEDLQAGDRVLTRDHGYQTLRWIGAKPLTADHLAANPALQPIRIGPGALGEGLPRRAMHVSPQHRMLMGDAAAELLFGVSEVLVRAAHLTHLPGVTRADLAEVTYVHLLFDRHEVVLADGAWSESFQPGDRTMGAMDVAARDELFALFPELRVGAAGWQSARPTLKRHEAQLLRAA